MGVFKRSGGKNIPLEEQLERLRQIGLSPCCDDFVDWILTEWSRAALEADPYDLLLFSLGGECLLRGQWAPLSNDIYCFDTECVEDDDIYAQVLMNLSRIAKGEFDIRNVTSAVDHDREKAEVSFTYGGKDYHWDLEYNDDWLDGAIFHRVNQLVGESGHGRMFYVSNPDQGARLIYGDGEQIRQVNLLVPNPFVPAVLVPQPEKKPAPKAPPARPAPAAAPAAHPKEQPKKRKRLPAQYAFFCLFAGAALIGLCGVYRWLADDNASFVPVYIMGGLGFALFLTLLLPIFEPANHAPKESKAAEPIEMTEGEVADAMEVLAPTVLPYIGLRPHRRPTGVYDSKFGGTPYLPPGFAYPRSGKSKLPLKLLCQLNFERLPRLSGFPERGILQFYLPCEPLESTDVLYGLDLDNGCEQTQWRVVYHRDIVEDEALLQSPPELFPERNSHFPFTGEFALEAELSSMPLICGDYRWDDFSESVWDKTEIAQRLTEKYYHYGEELLLAETLDKDVHKIGGYPQFAQWDPRAAGCREHTVLLLQIGSDLDIMWGDAGFANFFITPEALEQCDFSNVMYNWDCH